MDIVLNDLKLCLVFMTRIPLRLGNTDRSLAQAAALMPLVGVIVGLAGAVALFAAQSLGLPPLSAAAIGVLATILLTGALHEDGLADVADGFGGGLGKARKLEIMRDSRIGSYGVIAIGLSLVLRIVLIAEIASRFESLWLVTGSLIAAHTIGRGLLPSVMAALPLARGDGLAARADRPRGRTAGLAFLLSILITLFCLGPAVGITAVTGRCTGRYRHGLACATADRGLYGRRPWRIRADGRDRRPRGYHRNSMSRAL